MGDLIRLPVSERTADAAESESESESVHPPPLVQSTTMRCPACGSQVRVTHQSDDDDWDLLSNQFRFFRRAHANCDGIWASGWGIR